MAKAIIGKADLHIRLAKKKASRVRLAFVAFEAVDEGLCARYLLKPSFPVLPDRVSKM